MKLLAILSVAFLFVTVVAASAGEVSPSFGLKMSDPAVEVTQHEPLPVCLLGRGSAHKPGGTDVLVRINPCVCPAIFCPF